LLAQSQLCASHLLTRGHSQPERMCIELCRRSLGCRDRWLQLLAATERAVLLGVQQDITGRSPNSVRPEATVCVGNLR
jgi:hypothetical protein